MQAKSFDQAEHLHLEFSPRLQLPLLLVFIPAGNLLLLLPLPSWLSFPGHLRAFGNEIQRPRLQQHLSNLALLFKCDCPVDPGFGLYRACVFCYTKSMNIISALALFLALWPFSSGKTFRMTANQAVPAAAGTVKVQKDGHNKNTTLDVKVENLAKPASLTPPQNVYIVWVRPSGGTAVNEGAIRVDKNLNGELKAVTTLKECDVLVTAEQSPTATSPSGIEVLQAHVTL